LYPWRVLSGYHEAAVWGFASMIPLLRSQFNENFTAKKYRTLLEVME